MHYFIDGYNLLFRLLHRDENLQSQRSTLVQDLNEKISLLKIDASIVFDGTFQVGESSRSHYHQLEILYTAEGETADDYIMDEIRRHPHPEQETVVTSDKKLAWRVRTRLAHVESVEEFMLRLNRSYKNKLRHLKNEKELTPPRSPLPPPRRSVIPNASTPAEECTDYYSQIFEAEWKKIEESEKQKKQENHELNRDNKPLPRNPKKRRNLFEPELTPEEKAESEMERWQKIFERKLNLKE